MKTEAIRTIEHLRISGKWIEIWFEDGDLPGVWSGLLVWHECVKSGHFHKKIAEAGLANDFMLTGAKGWKTLWRKLPFGWGLTCIAETPNDFISAEDLGWRLKRKCVGSFGILSKCGISLIITITFLPITLLCDQKAFQR